MTVCVVAAIIRRGDHLLITRRPDRVHLAGLWEFPGGKVEPGESMPAALIREIEEEVGVKIEVLDEYFTVDHQYPTRSVELHFFNCRIVSGEPRTLQVAALNWVLPTELDQFSFPEADAELISLLKRQ